MNPSQTRGAVATLLPAQPPNDIVKASERHLRALARGMAGGEDDALEAVDRAIEMSIHSDTLTGAIDTAVVDNANLSQQVALFVQTLPPRLRLVVQKVIWEGLSQAAVAAEFGVSRMAVTK